jgi:membrane protein DedA with SNARE-associated domain
MRRWGHGGCIVALVLRAIVCLVVGLDGLRTLVGAKGASEHLEMQGVYTVGTLGLGLTMMLWWLTGRRSGSTRAQTDWYDAGEG